MSSLYTEPKLNPDAHRQVNGEFDFPIFIFTTRYMWKGHASEPANAGFLRHIRENGCVQRMCVGLTRINDACSNCTNAFALHYGVALQMHYGALWHRTGALSSTHDLTLTSTRARPNCHTILISHMCRWTGRKLTKDRKRGRDVPSSGSALYLTPI